MSRTSSWHGWRVSRPPRPRGASPVCGFEGVIEAVRAVVVPEEVGLPIEAFILATLAEHAPEADARFARAGGRDARGPARRQHRGGR